MFSFWSSAKPAQSAQEAQAAPAPPPPIPEPTATLPAAQSLEAPVGTESSLFSRRSMRQLGFFFAGAGFFTLSTIITRRAIARRQLAAFPKFYQQTNPVQGKVEDKEGTRMALEALNLATLNVMGFSIMCAGGVAWAFDISSLDDLRAYTRLHIGVPKGETDEAAEKEVEDLMVRLLARKKTEPQLEGSIQPRRER